VAFTGVEVILVWNSVGFQCFDNRFRLAGWNDPIVFTLEDRHRVFLNGIVYPLGRAVSYTGIALIIYFGAEQLDISGWFQKWGEKFLGPLLILIGFFMLDFIKLNLPGFGSLTDKIGERGRKSYLNTLLLGMLFAMAFCPYSGVLYFVMLIPSSPC